MSYSGRMQQSHYYSVFFAPRGRDRMYDLGMQIAQLYLSPFDKLIGVIGEAGSGKSKGRQFRRPQAAARRMGRERTRSR